MSKIVTILSISLSLLMAGAGNSSASEPKKDPLEVDCTKNLKLDDKTVENANPDDAAKTNLCTDLARVSSGKDNVPVSPAFTVLNVTPDTVIRPRTPNDFATSLLNNVDPNGNFQQGLALDFNPYLLWAGDRLTLQDYQNSVAERLLARTQISIATTKGREDDDKSARLALGLHVTPWLDSDPKLKDSKLLGCMVTQLSAAMKTFQGPPPPKSAGSAKQQAHADRLKQAASLALDPEKSARYKACRENHRKAEENSSGWVLGLAPSWNSSDGDLEDLEWSGLSFWSSLSMNLDMARLPGVGNLAGFRGIDSASVGQAVFHVRYTKDEEVANPAESGKFLEQDSLILSGKLRFDGPGGQDGDVVRDMKFSVAGALIDASRDNGVDDTYYQWSAEAEFQMPKIAENLYLVISAGTTSGREDENESFAGVSIKWGFTDTEREK